MKIYTKTGDDGSTGLLGPGRVSKDSPRVEAYGSVDELNAVIGVARATGLEASGDLLLASIQNDLFSVGAALADPNPSGRFHSVIGPDHAARLERAIDAMEQDLPPLTAFILPGGSQSASQIHLARTICRRAERLAVGLSRRDGEDVPHDLLVYLNRLSDLLFVLARDVNRRAGFSDVPWSGV